MATGLAGIGAGFATGTGRLGKGALGALAATARPTLALAGAWALAGLDGADEVEEDEGDDDDALPLPKRPENKPPPDFLGSGLLGMVGAAALAAGAVAEVTGFLNAGGAGCTLIAGLLAAATGAAATSSSGLTAPGLRRRGLMEDLGRGGAENL